MGKKNIFTKRKRPGDNKDWKRKEYDTQTVATLSSFCTQLCRRNGKNMEVLLEQRKKCERKKEKKHCVRNKKEKKLRQKCPPRKLNRDFGIELPSFEAPT